MSHEQVMRKFGERALPGELQKFEQLRRAIDSKSQTRALEMVIFKLTSDELFKIGLNEIEMSGRKAWLVALSTDSTEVIGAVSRVLALLGIDVDASFDLGMCGWRVHREEFFRAQRTLLEATNLQALGVEVHKPMFDLQ